MAQVGNTACQILVSKEARPMRNPSPLHLLAVFVLSSLVVLMVVMQDMDAYWLVLGPLLVGWTYLALLRNL